LVEQEALIIFLTRESKAIRVKGRYWEVTDTEKQTRCINATFFFCAVAFTRDQDPQLLLMGFFVDMNRWIPFNHSNLTTCLIQKKIIKYNLHLKKYIKLNNKKINLKLWVRWPPYFPPKGWLATPAGPWVPYISHSFTPKNVHHHH
jgi:hypothetical protein